jgi:hypothetical protein
VSDGPFVTDTVIAGELGGRSTVGDWNVAVEVCGSGGGTGGVESAAAAATPKMNAPVAATANAPSPIAKNRVCTAPPGMR